MTNAQKLAGVCGGGTNCAAPLEKLVREKAKVDVVFILSDNESWLDSSGYNQQGTYWRAASATGVMKAWTQIKRMNPTAKLVCLDVTPHENVQVINRPDILNVGGFSDNVWEIVADFVAGTGGDMASKINSVEL
jgi:60 kDa SS-A/Ro ribonucleoprotein